MTNEVPSTHGLSDSAFAASTNPDLGLRDCVPAIELVPLLLRCREDLAEMERLLRHLERPGTFSAEHFPGVQSNLLLERATTGSHSPIAINTLGADAVHRLAADIEDLCRQTAGGHVQQTLIDMQEKMVRCLKFLPSRKN